MAYTWNPSDKGANISLSNGNLTATSTTHLWDSVRSTGGKNSGKYYWEITIDDDTYIMAGVGTSAATLTSHVGSDNYGVGFHTNDEWWLKSGMTFTNSGRTPPSVNTNDKVCFALDIDNGKLWIGVNGVWPNSGNPADGTNECFTFAPGTELYPMISAWTAVCTANFGATAFAYTKPAGFTGIEGSIEDSTTESAAASDSMVGISPTEFTSESAKASAAFDGDSLRDSFTESAEATDTFGNEKTSYVPTTESATATDSMDALHLVDSITESAVVSGSMEAEEIIRKRIRFPNLQGKHLSLKLTSATDGSFAIYYLRHKMFKTRELCSDQKHPNTQGSHISVKLQNSGTDAFTLMYVSEEMQLVTT